MTIKPTAFFVENSKKIVLKFNKKIVSADKSSFLIKSLDSSDETLAIESISFAKDIVEIYTQQQKPGHYYSLIIKDDGKLRSDNNSFVTDVAIERTVFFSGFERFNPVRDNILTSLPRIFLNHSSKIKDIISEQSEELYSARRSVGQLLSDNYIRQAAFDEPRVRGSSPLDRLANENTFKVNRVSKFEEGSFSKLKKINYDDLNQESRYSMQDVVSLQEEHVSSKVFARDIVDGVISLDSNIIKLLSVEAISAGESIEYDIGSLKYSIMDDKYDHKIAFYKASLLENEVVLDKNFINSLVLQDDYLNISYLKKNIEISPIEDVTFYQIRRSEKEVLRINSSYFSLSYKNICDSNGKDINQKAFEFFDILNGEPSEYFTDEIPYSDTLPSSKGEFSVNYSTGEIFVYGDNGKGISVPVLISYHYKRFLKEDFDFYVYEKDISLNKSRRNINNFGTIEFKYDKVFEEGYHYIANTHKEVMPEAVGKGITSSFSFRVKNGPVTDVFRIVNKTTDEIYQTLGFSGNEIFFSGIRSPRINTSSESAKFSFNSERIYASEAFISNMSSVKISSYSGKEALLANNLPSSMFFDDTKYYVSNGLESFPLENIKKSSGEVISLIFSNKIPGISSSLFIGTRCAKFETSKSMILDSNLENLGSFLDSSIKLSSELFKQSKIHKGQNMSNSETFSSSHDINEAFLNREGNYIVDHIKGEIFLSNDDTSLDFGRASYNYALFDTKFQNNIGLSGCISLSGKEYTENLNQDDGFLICDIDVNFDFFEESRYGEISEENYPLEVNSNYEITLLNPANTVRKLFKLDSIIGKGSFSDGDDYIPPSENIDDASIPFSFDKSSQIVDLKNSEILTFSESEGFYLASIEGSDFGEFFDIKFGSSTVSSDRVFTKAEVLYRKVEGSSLKTIFVSNFEIFNSLNSVHDKINIAGSLYDIISFSSISGEIIIDHSDQIEGRIFLSQRLLVSENTLKIHSSSGIDLKSQHVARYVKTTCPEIGTAMSVLYNSGKISCQYTYLFDTINVYYEYGDNEIEWTSNGLKEGDSYFVSYEYGALRAALRVNFGLLTNVSMFNKFPLSTNREIYRDALEGTLGAFSKGSTVEAISEAVQSISKTEPDILEGSPKGWILGRDHLRSGDFNYKKDMSWGPVKYHSGLLFDKNSLSFPSKNSFSKDEGTVSFWTRNGWGKIENDAEITVKIPEFAVEKYNYSEGDSRLDVIGPVQGHGVEFSKRISVENKGSGFKYNLNTPSPLDRTKISFKSDISFRDPLLFGSIFSIDISDFRNNTKIDFGIGKGEILSVRKITRDFISSYKIKEYYKSTVFTGTYRSIAAEETLIKINLNSPLSGFDRNNLFLMTESGYLLKVVYIENKTLYAVQKPINWDGFRYNNTLNGYSLSNLRVCSLYVQSNNGALNDFNFLEERIEIDLDRYENIVSANGFESSYHEGSSSFESKISFKLNQNASSNFSRLYIENSPYFNEKFIFIGKNKKNPSSAHFKISEYEDGVPEMSSPGVYIYSQTNEEFDYDNRSSKYWVCEMISSSTIRVPVGSDSLGTIYGDVDYSFDANVAIESESNIYAADKAGSIVIEEKNFEFEEGGLFQKEKMPVDLKNTHIFSVNTTKYPIRLSSEVSQSDKSFYAHNSSKNDIFFGHDIPEFLENTEVTLNFSIAAPDIDYSSFYSKISGLDIICPLFEFSNKGIFIKAYLTEQSIVFFDKNYKLMGSFGYKNYSFNLKIVSDQNKGLFSVFSEGNSFSANISSESYDNYMKYLITDSENLSGEYYLYYPVIRFDISSFLIKIQNNIENNYSKDLEVVSYGKYVHISFNPDNSGYGYGYDGYGYDEYGYGYGYGNSSKNKAYFIAERPKYYFDTDNESFSIFRDYDGYLKFKISGEFGESIVSTEFSNLKEDALNHIAASWKSDDIFGSEMHLFINGEEAANINRFGDSSNRIQKIGGVSKEFVQDHLFGNVIFYPAIRAETVISTNEIVFSSPVPNVGQVLCVSETSNSYAGSGFIVSSVLGNRCSVLSAETLEPFVFNASDIIDIIPAPSCTPKNDLSSSKVGIFINKIECGTKMFSSISSTLISSDEISLVKSFIDSDKNIIYFAEKNEGSFIPLSERSDEIYIQTYGLFYELILESVDFGQTSIKSYSYGDEFESISSMVTTLPRPLSLGAVSIKKTILERSVPTYSTTLSQGLNLSTGGIDIFEESSTLLDREMVLVFESENLASGTDCNITIEGVSEGVSHIEEILFSSNSEKILLSSFSRIDRVTFNCEVQYADYEPFVLSIEEKNSLVDGKDAFLYKYYNGEFFLSSSESSYSPKEISSGSYRFSYRSKMRTEKVSAPNSFFIGSNRLGSFQSKSYMEEFKISQNLSGQTRPNNFDFNNFKDIYEEFSASIPTCPNNATLFLCSLNDPRDTQSIELKNIEFLDNYSNSKYTFSVSQVSELYTLMNSEELFVEKMQEYGFDLDTSSAVFIKVHKYQGMPFKDISSHFRSGKDDFIFRSYEGPTPEFDGSGIIKSKNVILNDKNIINTKKFCIESWFSCSFDTINSNSPITLFESTNAVKKIVKSSDFKTVTLPQEASRILSIRLAPESSPSEYNDNILKSLTSGSYVGSSGTNRSIRFNLNDDKRTVSLSEMLPGKNTSLEIFYLPKGSLEESMRVYIDENSNMLFKINANGKSYSISKYLNVESNSWNRFVINFDGSSIFFIINGKQEGRVDGISFLKSPVLISVASRYDESEKSDTRISNFKISRRNNIYPKDIDGKVRDEQFFRMIPSKRDEQTSYYLEFNNNKYRASEFAEVTNYFSSDFKFEVTVFDNFENISQNNLQKLLGNVINNIKPSHTKSIIRYENNRC